MMKTIYRICSGLLMLFGLGFVYTYLLYEKTITKFDAFNRPGYYVLQNFWYLFVSGIIAIAFSVFACFFSWFKKFEMVDVMMNAGYASKDDIDTWMGGSSLDTAPKESTSSNYENQTGGLSEKNPGNGELTDKTELLEMDGKEKKTEVLEENNIEEKTEIMDQTSEVFDQIPAEDKTLILQNDIDSNVINHADREEDESK